MIYASQFGGSLPLGSIVQGIGLAEPQHVRADGRALLKSAYPRLATLFPVGKLTGTIRTLVAVSANSPIAASPTYFVAGTGASASTVPVQYSLDGITWSTASVATGSNTAACVIWAGTRWVMAMAGATTQPHVTSGDNPNSTWTATTGGIASLGTSAQNCMAYSPTLNRVVLGSAASSASVYTLDGGSTAWTNRSGLASLYRKAVAWTGSVFLTANSNSATTSISADGITWAETVLPEAISNNMGYAASNGNGTAVITGAANAIMLTRDHGASFQKTVIPGVVTSDTWRVTYSGDRFYIPTAQGIAMSFNGYDWFLDLSPVQAFVAAVGVAKKGSTIVQVLNSTGAYSFTESATEFYVHNLQAFTPSVSGSPAPLALTYIKAL